MPYPTSQFRSSLLLLIAAWIAAVSFAAHLLMSAEISRRETRFEEDVRLLASDIQNKLDTNEAVLAGFSALLNAVGSHDEEAVAQYAASVAAAYPHIYMLEIARRVPVQGEKAFETSLRKQWRSDFSLKNFAKMTDRAPATAAQPDETWPILFLYPALPEAREIYGVRLETVDYLSHTLALALANRRPVGSPVFEMYEGGKAYILLQDVRRAPEKKTPGEVSLFGDQMVALMLIKTESLFPINGYQRIPSDISLSASFSLVSEPVNNLFDQDSTSSTLPDRLLLPRFEKNLRIGSASQPVNLHFARQLQWKDLMSAEKITIFCLLATVLFSIPALGIRHYRAIKEEVSEHQQSAFRATHDALTGLPNRFLLQEHFRIAQNTRSLSGKQMALLLIDLDFFKLINDHHGHAVGDEVLIAVAKRLTAQVRASDTVTRFGGDEFVVLLSELDDIADARVVAEKILESISTSIPTQAGMMNLSCSIGIKVSLTDEKESLDAMLTGADTAMYRSKKSGRNRAITALQVAE